MLRPVFVLSAALPMFFILTELPPVIPVCPFDRRREAPKWRNLSIRRDFSARSHCSLGRNDNKWCKREHGFAMLLLMLRPVIFGKSKKFSSLSFRQVRHNATVLSFRPSVSEWRNLSIRRDFSTRSRCSLGRNDNKWCKKEHGFFRAPLIIAL